MGGDGKGLAPRQTHVFLRLLEKDSDCSLQDIERVVDIVVIMPRHLLRRAYLELGDAKAAQEAAGETASARHSINAMQLAIARLPGCL